ncbi:hypothetical protein BCR36DRAFT_398040 [Piromyces finnis]|uniref:Uncharacterized protein n=1 Tax=Piromyces finnis TaxID=1754191 RepID=A0A1Y1V7B5_9FUNG|nr:hypothetical protein BCR36DRAFT_398040 [Piromyces finnis]|eukprot:ORX49015.1 hypothetical protein BCR36DRAFT_398040 [Piromyces finnis]
MVKKKNISTSDFKKISSARKQQLLKFEPSNEKMFHTIKKYIENNSKNKFTIENPNIKIELPSKDLVKAIKTELDSSVSLSNDINGIDGISSSLINSSNDIMSGSNQIMMDFMKLKKSSVNDLDSLGIPLNETFNQNPELLLNADTTVNDDYTNISELLTHFPANQATIPIPQPPTLHIPDSSIRTEISEMYLNNKYGKMDNSHLYSSLYDEGINNDDPAFNNIFNKLDAFQSPAITHHSSFKNNSFQGLAPQNQKLDLFTSSNDSLNNSLSFPSSSIGDNSVSLSFMNQLSSLNGLNSSGLSSYSDLTNTPNLTGLNNFSNSSSEILGINNLASSSSSLNVLGDVHSVPNVPTNPTITIDNTNGFVLTNPLLSSSLQQQPPPQQQQQQPQQPHHHHHHHQHHHQQPQPQHHHQQPPSISTSNTTSLSNTMVDTTGSNKTTDTTKTNLSTNNNNNNNNSLLSAIQESLLIPVSSLGETSTAAISLNDNSNVNTGSVTSGSNTPIPLNINTLDIRKINNQLLIKDILKNNNVTQNVTATPEVNKPSSHSTNLNNAKLGNDLLISYDMTSTPSTSTNTNIKDNNIPIPATKLNGKHSLKI